MSAALGLPGSTFRARALGRYYRAVAEVLLPALAARPVFLEESRKPVPAWVPTRALRAQHRSLRHLLVEDARTLGWLASECRGALHIPSSRVDTLDCADWAVFELVPSPGGWRHLVTVAMALQQTLLDLGLCSVPKTTGLTGLQVVVPLAPGHSHQQAWAFASAVAVGLASRFSAICSLDRPPMDRAQRVWLKVAVNAQFETMIAPYAARANALGTVSTPLHWREVTDALDVAALTIESVPERLRTLGDPFALALPRELRATPLAVAV